MAPRKAKSARQQSDKAEEQKVLVVGTVVEVLPGTEYKVEIKFAGTVHQMIGYVSGRMRRRYIRVGDNDKVILEIAPEYNIDKGRIVYKLDGRRPLPYSMEGKIVNLEESNIQITRYTQDESTIKR